MPPHHQLAFVRRFPAARVPRIASAELLTPPKVAAMPPPLPAWSRMAATRSTASTNRIAIRMLYSIEGPGEVGGRANR
jgi:hypothetical protein